jgi:hypothetical protein
MDIRTGLPWPPSRFGSTIDNISLSKPAKRSAGTGRRDKPKTTPPAPRLVPSGWKVAARAIKRMQQRYPSELELRPVFFNGHDTRVKQHVQKYGAARKRFERFMDRQTYWHWEWRQNEDDWSNAAPFVKPIYPDSVFQGRKKVENERRQCGRKECGRWFLPNRREAKFCSKACKQMAYRRRKGIEAHG